jgi:hypothetical protein
MTSRDFAFWLQGYFEIEDFEEGLTKPIEAEKVKIIKKHLAMVFIHEIDPLDGNEKMQTKLNEAHSSNAGPSPSSKNTVYRC